jgi:hypothetical protein
MESDPADGPALGRMAFWGSLKICFFQQRDSGKSAKFESQNSQEANF